MTTIEIESGRVRGLRQRGVVTWRSIPYAAPPVGPLRLRAPQPVTPWTGVRDSTRFGNAAHSHRMGAPMGVVTRQGQDEDCLTVNVCAPSDLGSDPSGQPRPVLVFIHGGGFFEGSSALPVHDPTTLVQRYGLVVVTLNYRLGGLGFVDFSSYSTEFESNLGLRDQVAALGWVQRNIGAFGGDPTNVTVFGQSAGGCSVLTLMAVPAARGLFQRAIAQSPIPDVVRTREQAADTARRCITALGAEPDTAADVLREAPATAISQAAIGVMLKTARAVPCQMALAPMVDGDLLPEAPLAAITAGRAHPVPLVIGTMRDELGHAAWGPVRRFVDFLPTTTARVDRMFAATDPAAKARALSHYPDYPNPAALTRLATDCFFVRPTVAAAEGHARYAPTYLYRLDYAPALLRLIGMGAIHATDVPMVFGCSMPAIQALTVIGRSGYNAVSQRMQQSWVQFAREGTPGWPAYGEDQSVFVFDHPDSRVAPGLHTSMWESWRHYSGPQQARPQHAHQPGDPHPDLPSAPAEPPGPPMPPTPPSPPVAVP